MPRWQWARSRLWFGPRWSGPRGRFWTGATIRFPMWAGYLNSHASAHARATLFTYEHIQSWLTLLVWIFRWIVVPAKVIPHAMASAQWGWRLPWRKLIRLLLNWRWWLAIVVAALVAVELPSHFFTGVPHGTVAHQVWAVILKLAGAYLLAVASWVLLLAWAAVLLSRTLRIKSHPVDEFARARACWLRPAGRGFRHATAARGRRRLRREGLSAATRAPVRGRSARAVALHTRQRRDVRLPTQPQLMRERVQSRLRRA